MHYEEELSLVQHSGGSRRDNVECFMLQGYAMHSKEKRGKLKGIV